MVAIGLGEDAAPREGKLRVALDREAESKRLTFGGLLEARQVVSIDGELWFSEPTANGKRASVLFSSTDPSNATRLPIEDVGHAYSCPQPAEVLVAGTGSSSARSTLGLTPARGRRVAAAARAARSAAASAAA